MSRTDKKKLVAYYIFRTKIVVRGVEYRARDYGKRAFKIPIFK